MLPPLCGVSCPVWPWHGDHTIMQILRVLHAYSNIITPYYTLLSEHTANGVDVAREAANRWLDNLEALRDWAKKQFSGREADVDAFFAQVVCVWTPGWFVCRHPVHTHPPHPTGGVQGGLGIC